MTQLIKIEPDRRDEILMEAADRQVPVVLSRCVDRVWSTYKSRFLQVDSAGEFLVLQQPMALPNEAPPEIAPGEHVGLSFRRGHKKCMSAVQVERLLMYDLGDGDGTPALQVSWPQRLQELQRRIYFRATVPSGRRIEVKLWEPGIIDSDGQDLAEVPHHSGLLQDLSAGGCRVIMPAVKDPQLQEGDSVRIRFQPDPRTEPLILDAMFRHVDDLPQRRLSLGFQFVGMELSDSGRDTLQTLARVVSTFLRIENRKQHNKAGPRNNPRRRPRPER